MYRARVQAARSTLADLVVKAAVAHTLTYFVAGVLASVGLDYASAFAEPGLLGYMRGLDDGLVRAGPLFQPLRGALFGLALHPIRARLFEHRDGWRVLTLLFVVLGVISPFGAAPGSIEGLVYTTVSVRWQIISLVEIVLQATALSWLLFFWVRRPKRRWLTAVLGVTFALLMTVCALGVLLPPPT